MRSSARPSVPLFLAVTLTCSTAGPSCAANTYCPQQVVGQWNGVWWHWCLVCPGGTSGAYVTDTRMHGIGINCGMIIDPLMRRLTVPLFTSAGPLTIPVRVSVFKHEPVLDGLSQDQDARQRKYIPLRKGGGLLGESPTPEDSFQRAATEFTITEERLVKLKDKGGNFRGFRLLLVKPNAVPMADLIGIGQEVAPADVAGITDLADWHHSFDKKRHHILKTNKSGKEERRWHVTSFTDFEKP